MHRSLSLSLLAAVALGAAAAPAAQAASAPNPDAAMRKGIRDYAKSVDATASKLAVDCGEVGRVGSKAACAGTFTLRSDAGATTYRLTSGARVLRVSRNGQEYKVVARRTGGRVAGLPTRVGGFSGFLQ